MYAPPSNFVLVVCDAFGPGELPEIEIAGTTGARGDDAGPEGFLAPPRSTSGMLSVDAGCWSRPSCVDVDDVLG